MLKLICYNPKAIDAKGTTKMRFNLIRVYTSGCSESLGIYDDLDELFNDLSQFIDGMTDELKDDAFTSENFEHVFDKVGTQFASLSDFLASRVTVKYMIELVS